MIIFLVGSWNLIFQIAIQDGYRIEEPMELSLEIIVFNFKKNYGSKKNINNKISVVLTKRIGKMFLYDFDKISSLRLLLIQYCKYYQIKI